MFEYNLANTYGKYHKMFLEGKELESFLEDIKKLESDEKLVIDQLEYLLFGYMPDIKRSFAYTLGLLKAKPAVKSLAKVALSNNEAHVVVASLKALGEIGPDASHAVRDLQALITRPSKDWFDKRTRHISANAIENIKKIVPNKFSNSELLLVGSLKYIKDN